jgi:CRISPR locus-related DNA-binding protein
MKVMIATFGVESGGIVDGIKHFGCEKLILLLSEKPQAEESIGHLKEIEKTAKQMRIPLEKIIVSQYSIAENIQKVKETVEHYKGNDVILNVTGGRKTLCLAATLAGFVSNPSRIVYMQEETHLPIEIPRFTLKKKVVNKTKRFILECVSKDTTYEEIQKYLKKNGGPQNYPAIMKHLRQLSESGLIDISRKRPQTYSITPSGELLR